MTEQLIEDDTVPIKCRHCSAVTIEVTVKEGNAVKRCTSCKGDTVIRVERRTGRWEIHTGPLPRKNNP
jgi:hypothetical protein